MLILAAVLQGFQQNICDEKLTVIAILTTVYPAVVPFFKDFLQGIESQTDSDFILCIVNDGVDGLNKKLFGHNFDVCILEASGTPAALRREGIDWVDREGLEWIVFADSDDICSSDRVARTRSLKEGVDGLFNDLTFFKGSPTTGQSLLSGRFNDGDYARSSDLINGNFLGLTNTVARTNLLKCSASQIPEDVIAFDWALFTRMVLEGAVIRYVDGSPTFYRQHSGNITGLKNISDAHVFEGACIKARHYELFKSYGKPFNQLADDYIILVSNLHSDESFLRDYCNAVRKKSLEYHLWWEPIKLPKELGL